MSTTKKHLDVQNIPCAFVCFHDDLDGSHQAFRRKYHNTHQAIARYFGGRLSVHVDNITEQRVDAVVNAANSELMGGGGVDGAIHRAAGKQLTEDCSLLRKTTHPNGLSTGDAVITRGGDMAAHYVIHTVGPIYGRHHGREADLLATCYRNVIALARQHGMKKIAFPAISTGIYGYPPTEAARIVFSTLRDIFMLANNDLQVRLIFLTREQADTFIAEAEKLNVSSDVEIADSH